MDPANKAVERAAELDARVLARARAGDEAALRELVDRYAPRVHALLWRMLGTRRALAEDLAQETFLRVIRALGRFDVEGPARLSTWILTIATRVALTELARPVRAVATIDDDVAMTADPRAAIDIRRRIARALAALGDDQRAIVVLREYHELSYEEIAAMLDLEIGTVRSRLARARDQLRALLAEAP